MPCVEWPTLPTPAVESVNTLAVVRCRQVASPSVHINMPGLLQLTTVRDRRQPIPTPIQAVRNAAARLITHQSSPTREGARLLRAHHARPAEAIHWLPVRQRVQFKIAVLMYKALHDLFPAYLAEDCQLVSVTELRRLRSSDTDKCLCAANQHVIRCCWTSSMEQSANVPAARVRHYTRTVSTSTQNASIWSLTAAASSYSVFRTL